MKKLAVGAVAAGTSRCPTRSPTTIQHVAEAYGRRPGDITALVLDRDRHEDLIDELRRTGARIKLIADGDITAAMSSAIRGTNNHLLIGIGGAREAVIAAAALACLGGDIQVQFWPRSRSDVRLIEEYGFDDPQAVLSTSDLVRGDAIVVATGISNGDLLYGVRYFEEGARTHSIVLCSRCNRVRFVDSTHNFSPRPAPAGPPVTPSLAELHARRRPAACPATARCRGQELEAALADADGGVPAAELEAAAAPESAPDPEPETAQAPEADDAAPVPAADPAPAAAPAPAPSERVEARPRDPVARVERSGPLAVITLDDPATRNALGEALLASLDAALDALEDDSDVRLVALTGAGRVFCAGAAIRDYDALPDGGTVLTDGGRAVLDRLAGLPVPVVALVNGHAVGGGAELALAADWRFVDPRAELRFVHAGFGLVPGFGGLGRLARLVGPAEALRLLATRASVDGPRAVELGLALAAVPANRQRERALELARDHRGQRPRRDRRHQARTGPRCRASLRRPSGRRSSTCGRTARCRRSPASKRRRVGTRRPAGARARSARLTAWQRSPRTSFARR